MIRTAASILNDLVTAMPVGVRHALVEVIDGVPSVHAGHGQFVPVINDAAGGVSYWRADGAASVTDIGGSAGCANAIRVSMPIALIGFVRRDQCDGMEAVLQAAVIQLRGALKPLRNSIAGVFGASVGSVSIGVDVVRTSEIKDFLVPASLAVLSMRFTLSIDGADDCLADACTPGDPVCALIQGLRWSRIEGCLTPTQTEQAIASLCEGGPCPTDCEVIQGMDASEIVACVPDGDRTELLCEVMDTDQATPEAIVVCLDGANKTDAVAAIICDPCPPCDPLEITVNSAAFRMVIDPCGKTEDVSVVDEADNAVGAIDGLRWRIPDADVTVNGTPYDSVLPGGSLDVPVTNSGANPVGTVNPGVGVDVGDCTAYAADGITPVLTLPAETNANLPQIGIKYTDADGNPQESAASDAEYNGTTLSGANVVPRRQILNTALNPANSDYADLADLFAGALPIAQDGTVTINNSVPTLLHTVPVVSNGAATQAIADSTITKPDATTEGLPATVALDVRDYRSGIAYSFGRIMWSGQTTEYRTGDEKDSFDAGFFDYARPVYPTHYAELGADWLTLAANNIHGNTLRFTNTSGGAAATTGDRVIQDHLTGLEWYRPGTLPTAVNWNDAIDAALALSADGKTDWILPPLNCLMGLVRYESGVNMNYGGFLITASLWTGTTNSFTTTQAKIYGGGASVTEANSAKTNTLSYICCRRFI